MGDDWVEIAYKRHGAGIPDWDWARVPVVLRIPMENKVAGSGVEDVTEMDIWKYASVIGAIGIRVIPALHAIPVAVVELFGPVMVRVIVAGLSN